jgi:hypothetical protein
MTGEGFLRCINGKSFKGLFKEGKLNGEGTFNVEKGTYSLSGMWNEGEAELLANKYLLEVLSPPDEEEEPNKAKGKPPAKNAALVEEEVGINALKVKIDV